MLFHQRARQQKDSAAANPKHPMQCWAVRSSVACPPGSITRNNERDEKVKPSRRSRKEGHYRKTTVFLEKSKNGTSWQKNGPAQILGQLGGPARASGRRGGSTVRDETGLSVCDRGRGLTESFRVALVWCLHVASPKLGWDEPSPAYIMFALSQLLRLLESCGLLCQRIRLTRALRDGADWNAVTCCVSGWAFDRLRGCNKPPQRGHSGTQGISLDADPGHQRLPVQKRAKAGWCISSSRSANSLTCPLCLWTNCLHWSARRVTAEMFCT